MDIATIPATDVRVGDRILIPLDGTRYVHTVSDIDTAGALTLLWYGNGDFALVKPHGTTVETITRQTLSDLTTYIRKA